jgi:arylsulfatase A-like enzyme
VFAWLHTMDVHAPYRPSYDAQVGQTDAALGVLYDHLAKHEPGAVIAVSADHGEALGERGRFGHGRTLDDDQVLVPLVLAGPQAGIRTGHVVAGVVEVFDLTPTIVALAGLPTAPWMDGRSLLPVIAGQPRPGGQRAFMEVRGLGGSFLRGVATPYATVVRDLRRDLYWVRPSDAPAVAELEARTLLLAWEEGVLAQSSGPLRLRLQGAD